MCTLAEDLSALLERVRQADDLEAERDAAYLVVGRLRSACRAVLTDLADLGEVRPFTKRFLEEVIQ